jgi:hypothetical protein
MAEKKKALSACAIGVGTQPVALWCVLCLSEGKEHRAQVIVNGTSLCIPCLVEADRSGQDVVPKPGAFSHIKLDVNGS